jgi:hypothetical protein
MITHYYCIINEKNGPWACMTSALQCLLNAIVRRSKIMITMSPTLNRYFLLRRSLFYVSSYNLCSSSALSYNTIVQNREWSRCLATPLRAPVLIRAARDVAEHLSTPGEYLYKSITNIKSAILIHTERANRQSLQIRIQSRHTVRNCGVLMYLNLILYFIFICINYLKVCNELINLRLFSIREFMK